MQPLLFCVFYERRITKDVCYWQKAAFLLKRGHIFTKVNGSSNNVPQIHRWHRNFK